MPCMSLSAAKIAPSGPGATDNGYCISAAAANEPMEMPASNRQWQQILVMSFRFGFWRWERQRAARFIPVVSGSTIWPSVNCILRPVAKGISMSGGKQEFRQCCAAKILNRGKTKTTPKKEFDRGLRGYARINTDETK